MRKWPIVVLAAAVILLLLADALAFHDVFEPHTGTEWLVLVASILAITGLAGLTASQLRTTDRRA